MKTTLKYLCIVISCLVVGALCAWLVLGKYAPVSECLTVAANLEASAQQYAEEMEAVDRKVESVVAHDKELHEEVRALRQASELDHAALANLRQEHEHAVLLAQQQIEQLEGDLTREKRLTLDVIHDRDALKQALKQLRADYIALANKNAALERASIEELAKAHKAGMQVTQRELSPIMQAVVNAAGIPPRVPQVKLP